MNSPLASLIIIGNEVLSGKTEDKNIQFLALGLSDLGIILKEVRIVPDIKSDIIIAVNELRKKYDYVFTTGGIGPTHDDITSESIAEAFNVKYVLNDEANKILEEYYNGTDREYNNSRKKMAFMPENASLIHNKETFAPGFIVENVYVMAGIPYVMHAMFDAIKDSLRRGNTIHSKSIDVYLPESSFAEEFAKLQNEYPEIEMGSYPFRRREKWGATLSMRSSNLEQLDLAFEKLHEMLSMFQS